MGFSQLRWLAKRAPLPLRLMLRAVEPLNRLRSVLILSVGLRPTPRTPGTSALCPAFGVWGSAPTLKSPKMLPSDCACVVRSRGGAVAEPTLRSVGVRYKKGRASWEWSAVNYPDAPPNINFKLFLFSPLPFGSDFWYIAIVVIGRSVSIEPWSAVSHLKN